MTGLSLIILGIACICKANSLKREIYFESLYTTTKALLEKQGIVIDDGK